MCCVAVPGSRAETKGDDTMREDHEEVCPARPKASIKFLLVLGSVGLSLCLAMVLACAADRRRTEDAARSGSIAIRAGQYGLADQVDTQRAVNVLQDRLDVLEQRVKELELEEKIESATE